jgi:hypothetical protein
MGSVLDADCELVDALARLQLVLRRHGATLLLRSASFELRELIELCGLTEVLPAQPVDNEMP